jgi:ABC-type amino acid transport system permease subunit
MIPGWVIALITFPGIILHEYSHKLFCNWTKTPVIAACYFNPGMFNGEPAGYVIHKEPKTLWASFLITVGPLIINSIMAVLCGVIVALCSLSYGDEAGGAIFAWLGYSIGVHSFPSDVDAQNYYSQVKSQKANIILRFIVLFFVWIIQLANVLRFLWFDFIYAGILVGLPAIIIHP